MLFASKVAEIQKNKNRVLMLDRLKSMLATCRNSVVVGFTATTLAWTLDAGSRIHLPPSPEKSEFSTATPVSIFDLQRAERWCTDAGLSEAEVRDGAGHFFVCCGGCWSMALLAVWRALQSRRWRAAWRAALAALAAELASCLSPYGKMQFSSAAMRGGTERFKDHLLRTNGDCAMALYARAAPSRLASVLQR